MNIQQLERVVIETAVAYRKTKRDEPSAPEGHADKVRWHDDVSRLHSKLMHEIDDLIEARSTSLSAHT